MMACAKSTTETEPRVTRHAAEIYAYKSRGRGMFANVSGWLQKCEIAEILSTTKPVVVKE